MPDKSAIYTYTGDQLRPDCPECGSPVEQPDDDPTIAFIGTCPSGHQFFYQYEEEEYVELRVCDSCACALAIVEDAHAEPGDSISEESWNAARGLTDTYDDFEVLNMHLICSKPTPCDCCADRVNELTDVTARKNDCL